MVLITFTLIHLAPGDPAAVIVGDVGTPADIERVRKHLGLDKPLLEQMGIYIGNLLRGDLGRSIFSGYTVTSLIVMRLEPTLALAAFSEFIAILLALPLGILAAWRANSWIDRAIMIFAVIGFSIPVFWLGFNLIWLFAVKLRLFPAVGYTPLSRGVLSSLHSLTLPAFTLGIVYAALIARMTRATVLEILREDYVRTARAKGLGERIVLLRHALKNAAVPIVTIIGLGMAGLVAGVVITETVFAIPGLGRLIVDAVLRRDYPIIQGTMILITVSFVFLNLITDLSYAYLDPRIRY